MPSFPGKMKNIDLLSRLWHACERRKFLSAPLSHDEFSGLPSPFEVKAQKK